MLCQMQGMIYRVEDPDQFLKRFLDPYPVLLKGWIQIKVKQTDKLFSNNYLL